MLAAYQKTKEQLSLIDCTILQPQFSILWQTLSDGVFTLNWNSQRINTYINTCNKVVAEFQSIVSQVHKNAIMIENVEAAISNEKLIRKTDFLGPTGVPLPPMPVTEFYDMIEMNRVSRLDVLSTKYRSMGRYFDKVGCLHKSQSIIHFCVLISDSSLPSTRVFHPNRLKWSLHKLVQVSVRLSLHITIIGKNVSAML